MKAHSTVLLAAILGGLLIAGCLSPQASNDLPASQRARSTLSITLLSPAAGEKLKGVVEIRWQSNGATGPAKVDLYYTTDPKPFCPTCPPQKWHEIATGLEDTGVYRWDTSGYPPSDLYMIKAKLITDSEAVENTTSAAFTILEEEQIP